MTPRPRFILQVADRGEFKSRFAAEVECAWLERLSRKRGNEPGTITRFARIITVEP